MTDPKPPEKELPASPEKISIRRGIESDGLPAEAAPVTDRRGRPVYLTEKKKKIPPWLAAFMVFLALMAGLFIVVPRLTDREPGFDMPGGNEPLPTEWDSQLNSDKTAVVAVSSAPLFESMEADAVRIAEALFNEAVTMLDTRDRVFIKVRLSDGMTGYMRREDLAAGAYSLSPEQAVAKVLVRVSSKRIMSHARQGSLLVEAPMGSVFYADYRNGDLLRVRLPGMTQGWINVSGVMLLPPAAPITAEENTQQLFVATLMGFYNSPLVPGGVTSRGISMEGALYVAGLLNGMELPRDPEKLMKTGTAVRLPLGEDGNPDLSAMEEGDIVFFYSKADPAVISSMAVRVSDNQLLAALPNRSVLTLTDLESSQARELSGRILAVRRPAYGP